MIASSTPYGRGDHWFHTTWRTGQPATRAENHESWSWPSNVSPLVDRELLKLWRATTSSREYQAEVEAQWTDDSGSFFTYDELEQSSPDIPILDPTKADRRTVIVGATGGLVVMPPPSPGWTAPEDRLTDPDDLSACVTLDGALAPQEGLSYVIAVDLGLKHDRTAAVVAHAEPVLGDGGVSGTRVVLDRIEVWAGHRLRPVRLETVEAWVDQAARAYNKAPVIFDPWQAVGMAQRLSARGVRTVEFTFTQQSVGRLASALHLVIRDPCSRRQTTPPCWTNWRT